MSTYRLSNLKKHEPGLRSGRGGSGRVRRSCQKLNEVLLRGAAGLCPLYLLACLSSNSKQAAPRKNKIPPQRKAAGPRQHSASFLASSLRTKGAAFFDTSGLSCAWSQERPREALKLCGWGHLSSTKRTPPSLFERPNLSLDGQTFRFGQPLRYRYL